MFADNGRLQFVTDFLWRSPLKCINAQDTAGVTQTEDSVKIRDQLTAKNGLRAASRPSRGNPLITTRRCWSWITLPAPSVRGRALRAGGSSVDHSRHDAAAAGRAGVG